MGDLVGEWAIVGEDEQALAVFVESAGVEEFDFLIFFGKVVEDGFFVKGVVVAAEDALGLVHNQDDLRRRCFFKDFAVHFDSVGRRVDFLSEMSSLPVDRDKALFDPRFCFAP